MFLDLSNLFFQDNPSHIRWHKIISQDIRNNNGFQLPPNSCGEFLDLSSLFFQESTEHLKWSEDLNKKKLNVNSTPLNSHSPQLEVNLDFIRKLQNLRNFIQTNMLMHQQDFNYFLNNASNLMSNYPILTPLACDLHF